MSNQGWSQLPRKNKTTGDKVFDVVTWPFRKVFHAVTDVVLTRHARKKAAESGATPAEAKVDEPVAPPAPTPPPAPRR